MLKPRIDIGFRKWLYTISETTGFSTIDFNKIFNTNFITMKSFIGKKIRSVISSFPNRKESEFTKRIRHRHKIFWEAPNAEVIRNTHMSASDPIEKWMDVENWQRKLSNKHNSREFAKMHGCRVAELYWRGRNVKDIPFDKLPEHYVIRPTIGYSCGMVFVMQKGVNLLDKKPYGIKELQAEMSGAVEENPYLEFLVEEFVRTEKGEYNLPDDYKIYTFNGEIASIRLINRVGVRKGFFGTYDADWNEIEIDNTSYPAGSYQEPPACLEEMVACAKRLSKAYGIFVRIDFYATDKGAVFGEFTPTPTMGYGYTTNASKKYEAYWDKYCAGMI